MIVRYHKLLYQGKDGVYQNDQKYTECQLISALNAAYCLGEQLVHPDSEEYERLIDLTGARYGNCTSVYKAYEYLRLNYINTKPEFESIEFATKMGLPIGVGVRMPDNKSLHSTVVIDMKYNYKVGDYQVRVPNLKRFTDRGMWIKYEEYKDMIHVKENIHPERGFFRIFYQRV
ncbi:MAG: hypothetical protein PVG65_03445 [Candidatus Thorarchaeota archaeon]